MILYCCAGDLHTEKIIKTEKVDSSSNGDSSSSKKQELNGNKSSSNSGGDEWFDVGIIKGTTCTVASFYLPNEDGASTGGIENEALDESVLKKVDLQVRNKIFWILGLIWCGD